MCAVRNQRGPVPRSGLETQAWSSSCLPLGWAGVGSLCPAVSDTAACGAPSMQILEI